MKSCIFLRCIHNTSQSACSVLASDPFHSWGLGTTHRHSSKHTPLFQSCDIADTARKHTLLVRRQNFNPTFLQNYTPKGKSLFAQSQNAHDIQTRPLPRLIYCSSTNCLSRILVTFKSMTSRVVQRPRSLSGHVWLLGRQRAK